MKKKEYKFLDDKLLELVNNNIISNDQYSNAKDYFYNKKSERKSVVTIFLALGVLLVALSIITIFAVNWDELSKSIKVIISLIPLVLTSIILYISMYKNDTRIKLYTSIFAPIAILATNSLISQIFHMQTEVYELIFISLIMFLPIAFILRNYISIIVYGIGTIIYSFNAIGSSSSETISLINASILTLPIIIYNITNYRNNKDDEKNIVMWMINTSLVTLLLAHLEILSEYSFIIYLYLIYLITKYLFTKENFLNKLFSFTFIGYLIITCTSPYVLTYFESIKLGVDSIVLLILSGILFFILKLYKEPKQCFIAVFILLLQFSRLHSDILFILTNIIAGSYGIYNIVIGNSSNSNKNIKQGIALILLLILFRFISSDLSFMQKSMIFLVTGIGFMISANLINKKGGKKNE